MKTLENIRTEVWESNHEDESYRKGYVRGKIELIQSLQASIDETLDYIQSRIDIGKVPNPSTVVLRINDVIFQHIKSITSSKDV